MTPTALQLVAIAGAAKKKALEKAKAELGEGRSFNVDPFVARFGGIVNVGLATPPGTAKQRASLDLLQPLVIAELLRRLKVDPAKLRRILLNIARDIAQGRTIEVSPDLLTTFDDVQQERAESMPMIDVDTPGRAAAVRPDIAVEVLPINDAALID